MVLLAKVALTPHDGHGVMPLGGCRGLVAVLHLERDGADLADRGVPASPVVAVLDPGSDGHLHSGLGGPDSAVVELGLKGGEE